MSTKYILDRSFLARRLAPDPTLVGVPDHERTEALDGIAAKGRRLISELVPIGLHVGLGSRGRGRAVAVEDPMLDRLRIKLGAAYRVHQLMQDVRRDDRLTSRADRDLVAGLKPDQAVAHGIGAVDLDLVPLSQEQGSQTGEVVEAGMIDEAVKPGGDQVAHEQIAVEDLDATA